MERPELVFVGYKELTEYLSNINLYADFLESRIEKLEHSLNKIKDIIETVDNRCMAIDGPVTPTLQEMTQREISEIYKLSKVLEE